MTARSPKTVIVTGGDAAYFPFLRDMVESIASARRARGFACAVFDYGLTSAQVDWLKARVSIVVQPTWRSPLAESLKTPRNLVFTSRLFLPEELPGFDVYFWFDADAWLQVPEALDAYVDAAVVGRLGIATEDHRAYRLQAWLQAWTAKHFLTGYGPWRGLYLYACRHLNAGLFALRHDAPHWEAWRARLTAAIARSGRVTPHDQFGLNQVVWQDRLPTRLLPPQCNWICDRGPPAWNAATHQFCIPDASHAPIGIMHLAGPAKTNEYAIAQVGGGTVATGLTYAASRRLMPQVSGPRSAA